MSRKAIAKKIGVVGIVMLALLLKIRTNVTIWAGRIIPISEVRPIPQITALSRFIGVALARLAAVFLAEAET